MLRVVVIISDMVVVKQLHTDVVVYQKAYNIATISMYVANALPISSTTKIYEKYMHALICGYFSFQNNY